MSVAVTNVALSWLPSEEEFELIRAGVCSDVEFVYPDEGEIGWSRFACSPAALARLVSNADALMGWAAPSREAIIPIPGRNSPMSPMLVRRPSGKISTENPVPIRSPI